MTISKYLTLFSLLLLVAAAGCANEPLPDERAHTEEPAFDAELAEALGADNYGMSRYVMALLKAGPNQDHNEETARQLQEGHMETIRRLADEGKLVVAGPFLDGGELRGIYIFDVATVEEARELTETDPAIQAGRLAMELHPWYGSAALKKVTEIHRRISKENP